MKQPTMVYRHPGKHKIQRGMFDYKLVEGHKANEEEASELEAALADGWFASPAEAKEGVDSTSAPTREELEEKATELGIEFPKNIKDETLLKKIEEKLSVSIGE